MHVSVVELSSSCDGHCIAVVRALRRFSACTRASSRMVFPYPGIHLCGVEWLQHFRRSVKPFNDLEVVRSGQGQEHANDVAKRYVHVTMNQTRHGRDRQWCQRVPSIIKADQRSFEEED